MSVSVTAIILAAGSGRRIGAPKWQLQWNHQSFLEIILSRLQKAPISALYCVVSQQSIPTLSATEIVINPNPGQGMLSSIHCGIQADTHASKGYLIIPVDHPFVLTETYHTLIQSFVLEPDVVIRPRYQSSLGHPIILPRRLAMLISENDYAHGLRQFLINQQTAFSDIKVQDESVLKNINTREDLEYLQRGK